MDRKTSVIIFIEFYKYNNRCFPIHLFRRIYRRFFQTMQIEIKFAYTFNARKNFISQKSVCNMVKNDRQVFDLEARTVNFKSLILSVNLGFNQKKNTCN